MFFASRPERGVTCQAGTRHSNRHVAGRGDASPGTVRPSAFTLLELLAVLGVIAVLTGIVIGVGRHALESGKIARARTELAALAAALDAYRAMHGDYPRTDDGPRLLQSLLGRCDPVGRPAATRAAIDVSRFVISDGRDPAINPAVQLLDPWGEPYRYAYKTQSPWRNSACVIYSIGPDSSDFPRLLSGGFPDRSAPANADNIYADR